MESIFKDIPLLKDIDVTKFQLLVHNDRDISRYEYDSGSDSDSDSGYSSSPDEFYTERQLLYNGKPFLVRCKLSSNRTNLQDLRVLDIPSGLKEKMIELGIRPKLNRADWDVLLEVYGKNFVHLAVPDEMVHLLLKREDHEGIAVFEQAEVGDFFHFRIVGICFKNLQSYQSRMYDRVEEIEKTLDKPGNLGSISGLLSSLTGESPRSPPELL